MTKDVTKCFKNLFFFKKEMQILSLLVKLLCSKVRDIISHMGD